MSLELSSSSNTLVSYTTSSKTYSRHGVRFPALFTQHHSQGTLIERQSASLSEDKSFFCREFALVSIGGKLRVVRARVNIDYACKMECNIAKSRRDKPRVGDVHAHRSRRHQRRQSDARYCAVLLVMCYIVIFFAIPVGHASLLFPEDASYKMSWPGGRKRVTKMSDYDVASDPACYEQQHSPVNWGLLRDRVYTCVKSLDPRLNGTMCREAVSSTRRVTAGQLDIDTRYSTWRNDCYLGYLAAFTCDVVCSMQEALAGVDELDTGWLRKWHKMQLELEGLMFYVELPWSTLMLSDWQLPALFARLGIALRKLAPSLPNKCDELRNKDDDKLLTFLRPDGLVQLSVAEEFVMTQAVSTVHEKDEGTRCPLGLVVSILSLAVGAIWSGGYLDRGTLKGFRADMMVNAHAQSMFRMWEESTTQFFFDVLTTQWRVFNALEIISQHWGLESGPEAAKIIQRQTTSAEGIFARNAFRLRKRAELNLHQVLFLGGGATTFQWGSYTVRGRQSARGLRALGVDARAWSGSCDSWCVHAREALHDGDGWTPSAIVHIKFICECAFDSWRHGALHIYDPIDVFRPPEHSVDAILVQTSLARADLAEHPPLRASKRRVSIVWHPLHHSNAQRVRAFPLNPVTRVGVHTVHHDEQLQQSVEMLLENTPATFVHMDPAVLFAYADGRISTPQQTDALYEQLATLDIGVVKQSGCISEWWHCSRWKTGQRLINLLSVGVPTIVWGDAQGHLDIVEGRWPQTDECGPVGGAGWNSQISASHKCAVLHTDPNGERYPEELLVRDDDGMRDALHALMNNETLRQEASSRGLRLASRYSLSKVSRRFLLLLDGLARERLARRCRLERHRFGRARWGRRPFRWRWRQRRYCG